MIGNPVGNFVLKRWHTTISLSPVAWTCGRPRYPEEEEVLFPPGSTFEITSTLEGKSDIARPFASPNCVLPPWRPVASISVSRSGVPGGRKIPVHPGTQAWVICTRLFLAPDDSGKLASSVQHKRCVILVCSGLFRGDLFRIFRIFCLFFCAFFLKISK